MKGKYRHELKFNITYADYLILRPRLRSIMQLDPHTDEKGLYQIHSIYFDNYQDKALREKVDGVQKREKYRIRWYNTSKDIITLEKKMKVNSLCMKFGTKITEEQLNLILMKDYHWMLESNDELIKEFYYRLFSQRLTPTVLVSYVREPYIYKYGNVRITFDSCIRTSLVHHNWNYDSPFIPVTDQPQQMILEVKFDEYLPSVIAQILQLGNLRQIAFSKYGACRKFG